MADLDIKRMSLLQSVENGCRPSASETCLPAPMNFPFGDDQDNSGMSFMFTLRMIVQSLPW